MRKYTLLLVLFLWIIAGASLAPVLAQDATPTPEDEATPETTESSGEPTELTQPESGSYAFTTRVGGVNRPYHFYVPENHADREGPVPLVVVLHGVGSSGLAVQEITGFNALADEENFITAYPNGLDGVWNDGRGDRQNINIDDVTYIADVIDFLSLQVELDIDPTRVYVVGYSMGGMMALRIACTVPDIVAAVGAVAAAMPVFQENLCNNSGGFPVIFIAGTEDPFVPYEGIEDGYFSGPETLDYWRRLNICGTTPESEETIDEIEDDETSVTATIFPTCLFNNALAYYEVEGGGHTWPSHPFDAPIDLGVTSEEIDATQVVWDFVSNYTLDVEESDDE